MQKAGKTDSHPDLGEERKNFILLTQRNVCEPDSERNVASLTNVGGFLSQELCVSGGEDCSNINVRRKRTDTTKSGAASKPIRTCVRHSAFLKT